MTAVRLWRSAPYDYKPYSNWNAAAVIKVGLFFFHQEVLTWLESAATTHSLHLFSYRWITHYTPQTEPPTSPHFPALIWSERRALRSLFPLTYVTPNIHTYAQAAASRAFTQQTPHILITMKLSSTERNSGQCWRDSIMKEWYSKNAG